MLAYVVRAHNGKYFAVIGRSWNLEREAITREPSHTFDSACFSVQEYYDIEHLTDEEQEDIRNSHPTLELTAFRISR
jgi:hypothetical protein